MNIIVVVVLFYTVRALISTDTSAVFLLVTTIGDTTLSEFFINKKLVKM